MKGYEVAIIGTIGLIAVANINHFANPPSSANIPRHISSIIWSLKTKLIEPDNRSSNNNNISNKSTITHRSKGRVLLLSRTPQKEPIQKCNSNRSIQYLL